MMARRHRKVLIFLVALLFTPFAVMAQNGSAAPSSATSSATSTPAVVAPVAGLSTESASTSVATSSPPASGLSQGNSATTLVPATSTPRAVVSAPTTPVVPVVVPTLINSTSTTTTSPIDTGSNPILWIALAAVATLPFGYLIGQSLNKKKEGTEEKTQCFDIKQLLDKKLKELTDLKARLESEAQDRARENLDEAVAGTSIGNLLVLVKNAEKEYERFKKLYEECMAEWESHMFKGTIVENSLHDKSILDKVETKKTYQTGDWTVRDVLVHENQISELSKYLDKGSWYTHFWQSGNDEVRVVFRDKMFTIKYSDKSTWAGAVAYGKSIGIPSDQLDFSMD